MVRTSNKKISIYDESILLADDIQSLNFKGSAITGSIDMQGNVIEEIVVSGGGAVDSVNGQTGVVVLTTNDVAEVSDKKYLTNAEETKLGNITVTQAVNLDTIESDTATNNAKVTNATHTGDAEGATALMVKRINGVALSGLATGILKNTTTTGVPSIAVAGDFPTLNQNTTGSAATLTTGRTIGTATGDVTSAGSSFNGSANNTNAYTIATAAVTNAKLANMATKTYKGRTTAGTGVPEDVSVATLKTDLTLVKADVGLGNVDNTSDATKNSATVTLTNKTVALGSNTVSGTKAQFDTACTDGNFQYVGDRKQFRYLIAPSNASASDKAIADVTLTGTADQTLINAALVSYRNVEIAAGTVTLTGAISIIGIPGGSGTDSPTFQLRGQGKHQTIIQGASNLNVIELTSDPSVIVENLHIKPLGSGHGIKSTAYSTSYRGFWMSMFKNIFIEGDFSTHTGYALYLEGPFRSTFENIEGLGIANGMYLSATNSSFNPGNCSFIRCFFDLYSSNGKGYYFYTPDTGGQFNICRFMQCEAIDSAAGSTTSVGMHFRGSATDYFATKNILVDSTNLEGFNTAIKFEHAISNRCSFNFIDVKANGTYVQFSSDSYNNNVEILSSYIPTSRTVTIVNDANYSTSQPNIVSGIEAYADTGSTVNATLSTTTVIDRMGISGPGTVATALTTKQGYLMIQDQKAANTAGGGSTATTWNTRTLNTVVRNTITGASLASNQITLPAGVYNIRARCPAFIVSKHKSRLRNITDTSTTLIGSSSYTDGADAVQNDTTIMGQFTITGTKVFELQHYTELTRATNGFGVATNATELEVYSEIEITRLM